MANTINVTSDTVVKLIIRRGTNADRQGIVLASGELGYAYDIKRIFIGDGVTYGGNLVGTKNFGIVQGIQTYTGVAQPGDIIFQNLKSDGTSDNTLYAYNNNQWQPISPSYGAPFDYTSGSLLFNSTYLNLDTTTSTLNVVGSVSASNTISTPSLTIYNQPTTDTDGTNKLYVDSQIAAAGDSSQAYTRAYTYANYVPLSGNATVYGTLSSTVNISVSTAPVSYADVTNKLYVDTAITNTLNAANAYTDLFLPLAGGILVGPVSSDITSNGNTPAFNIVQRGNGAAFVVRDTNRGTPQSFFVDNYGSVGVGVIPPNGGTTALTVFGTASATTSIARNAWVGTTGNGLGAPAVNAISISTAGSEALRVVSSGNVGIGTTAPLYKLDVNGNTRITGTLSATGDVIAYASSDTRLKHNVKPIESALQKIDQISGVEYDWNTELQSTYSGHDIGVLAQEVESVLPEAVITREDGYKAVNYEKIIPLLIQAIKELKANQKS